MLFATKVFSRANKYGEDGENVSRVHKEANYIADLIINLYIWHVSVISNTQQLKCNVVQMLHTFSS